MAVLKHDSEAAWLDTRSKVLTASQAAIVWSAHCGLKQWPGSTPYDVWAEKSGEGSKFEGNIHTWFGHAMEPAICKWAADELGGTLEYPEPYTIITSNRYEWMACTPDAYVVFDDGRRHLLEAKTASWPDEWGPSGTTIVPPTYLAQCTWQMATTEVDTSHLACLLITAEQGWKKPKVVKDLRRYTFARIPIIEDLMIDVCYKFWKRYVVGGFPPPKSYPAGGEPEAEAA